MENLRLEVRGERLEEPSFERSGERFIVPTPEGETEEMRSRMKHYGMTVLLPSGHPGNLLARISTFPPSSHAGPRSGISPLLTTHNAPPTIHHAIAVPGPVAFARSVQEYSIETITAF
ncbi:MAG TPA: hypothetical protein PLA66_09560, partial [Mesotoga sp.]|nr:hypothetical protein [Mesotoga sp.]